MAFSSPSKIPRVEGDEFVLLRDQFCLLAYSVLDEGVTRQGVHRELTELGIKVMRKFAGLNAQKKYLRKELAEVRSNLEKLKEDFEVTKAGLDFVKDDYFDAEGEDGAQTAKQGPGESAVLVEEEMAEED